MVAIRRLRLHPRGLLLAGLALGLLLLSEPAPTLGGAAMEPNFVEGSIDVVIDNPTSLAFGPDGRLYAASGGGTGVSEIWAFTLDPTTHQVMDSERIATGLVDVMGIAFDPAAPSSPVAVYASNRDPSATDGFDSRISTFTSPTWTRTDIITGLPTSRPFFNHLTNGLAFDALGRLLIAQGSSTDAGLADPFPPFGELDYWPETPLSSAILLADIHAGGFDGAITYDPAGPPTDNNVEQAGGDVDVFAAGFRNPFDLVVHSNGYVYATDNGPIGPNKSVTCVDSDTGVSAADELNLAEEGDYYGHPNRNRGLGLADPRQCTYHAPEEGDGADFTGPIAVLPGHCSCDGMVEYTHDAFGGAMMGDLLIAQWSLGNVARVELSADGRSVDSVSTLAPGFSQPLDVTVGPDGTIYLTEFGSDTISYLAPDSDRDGCADGRELGPSASLGGQRDPDFFWDFFDVPAGQPAVRDRVIFGQDISAVVARFGSSREPPPTKEEALTEALTVPPGAPAYHTAFDRTPLGPDAWDSGPPDGSIFGQDIALVVAQFGHQCA